MRNKLMCILGSVALLTIVSANIGASPGDGQAFSISAHPSAARIRAGAKATYTVIIDSQSFEGTVALSCQSGARSVACSASPSSVWVSPTLTASVMVVAVTSSETPPGMYDLTITATGTADNVVSHQSTTVTLLVE